MSSVLKHAEDCTAKRRSYQGAAQGTGTRQYRGNGQQTTRGRGQQADQSRPVRA